MRKTITSPSGIAFTTALKLFASAFKSLFQSSSNREFRRLKDFISS